MAITERYVNDAGSGDGTGSSEANAMSYANFTDYMSAAGSFTAAAGDRFNIKGAITARTTTADAWVNGGTVTSPVIIRGYNSTIGDLTTFARSNSNGALITTNFPTITYTTGVITITGSFIIMEALNISGARAGAQISMGGGSDNCMVCCVVSNSSTNASASCINGAGTSNRVFCCDAYMTGASGGVAAITTTAGSIVDSCLVKVVSATALGITASGSGGAIIYGNLIYSGGAQGIGTTATGHAPFIRNNTIVGCAGDGVNILTASTHNAFIVGNMITDNAGDGIDMVSTANAGLSAFNRLRDNANSYNNAGDWTTATSYQESATNTGTTGDTSTDYTNYSAQDYNLLSTSPATGANLPKFSSIGAFQRPQILTTQFASVFG